MILINKIWSEDKKFKTLKFNLGMNFIVGDSSKDKNGNINNEQRNGSGKSLSIELINFALMKKSSESRIYTIPDSILPQESFVYIDLTVNSYNIIIARNKKNEVLMQIDGNGLKKVSEKTAKDELANLSNLEGKISFREMCNFMIKESSYTYSTFLYFFISNTIERLRTSLYFFDLPIDLFEKIRSKQDEYESLNTVMGITKRKIENKGLNIDKLRSLQSELGEKIEVIENGLSYEEISVNISDGATKLQEQESLLMELLREKGRIEYQLNEINDFLNHQEDEAFITDPQLQRFFNGYIKGLGDFVQRDLEELKKFRDEIYTFETEMLVDQKEGLDDSLMKIKTSIILQNKNIEKYRSIIDDGKNILQKGLKISHELISDFNDNSKLIENYDEYDQSKREINSEYQKLYSELESDYFKVLEKESSFRKTFLDIHEQIYGDKGGVFAFDLSSKRNIKDKEFFKIKAEANRQGSEGVNRVRQIIYDLSLLVNEFTSEKTQKLLIHDRLLFGDIDNDATFNILNYINTLKNDSFQYIATYNSDVIPKKLASQKLNFDIAEKTALTISVEDPLFYVDFKKAIDFDPDL